MDGSTSIMVSGRVSRFTFIPDTPEMTSTNLNDPDWGLFFLMSFPSINQDQANAYHATWKKKGYGTKETVAALQEQRINLSEYECIRVQTQPFVLPPPPSTLRLNPLGTGPK